MEWGAENGQRGPAYRVRAIDNIESAYRGRDSSLHLIKLP